MPRNKSVLALAAVALLALAAVAVAKPTPASTTTTFSAVHDESSLETIFAGKISSGKAVCKAKRKVLVSKSTPLPPGFQPLGVATSEEDGRWTLTVPDILAGDAAGLSLVVKSKRVGDVLCKGARKKLPGGVGSQP